MTGLRRAFLAVVPPPSVLRWAESAENSAAVVAPDLRWTRREQRHLTLRFFGAVPDPDPLAELVADAVRARDPFTVCLGGGGAFPDPRRASVLWLGVRQGSEALGALAAAVGEPDDRPYVAHLTLARVNRSRDLREVVAALDACGESDAWTVDEVVLFDSDGSMHTEQARFRLTG
ncbi:MAG TPA: RNA 2',3'-cyclic phosphodiesterase [Acidimicrobiia bacterium]|nr:RNA 2',3'-cyclic phosphodiesterase [Acidimicrobiia bacterium]